MCVTQCQANQSTETQAAPDKSPEVGKGKKLLIIGGTGRVGSSTAASLRQTHPNLTIILGSQSQDSYDAAVKNRPSLQGLAFSKVNRNDLHSILAAVKECDVVLHCAGPFQRKNECLVLEAAIQAKKPYIGEPRGPTSRVGIATLTHPPCTLLPPHTEHLCFSFMWCCAVSACRAYKTWSCKPCAPCICMQHQVAGDMVQGSFVTNYTVTRLL